MKSQGNSRRRFLGQVASGLTLATVPALGANDRVRVGIIGAGDRGLELLHQVHACANTEVVAFADIYSKRLEKAASLLPGARLHSDYRSLLDDSSIDAVVIAAPPHLHAEQFVAALKAGKHVYLEKTLALCVEDAKVMRTAYEAACGRHAVQIGHQACSSGHASDVARLLSEPDHLGPVTALAMRHYRNTPAGKPQWARPSWLTSEVHPGNILWEQFSQKAFDANHFVHWRYFWEYSGGPVSEYLSQQLAFWYRALNLDIPNSATAAGGVYLWRDGRETPDTLEVSFAQPEDMFVTWSAGFGNNHLGTGEELLGHNGTIVRNNQVRYVPQKMTRPEGAEMLGRSTGLPHGHMQNFLDAVRFGSQTSCTFELGYRVAIASIMAVESYRQGRTVNWDRTTETIV